MIRRSLVLALVVCGAVVAPTASGSPQAGLPLRLGVGIGPINLGMTGQQVRRALGGPRAVIERRVVRGQAYVELEFGVGTWNVGLLGPSGNRRVVLVGTVLARHRTQDSLGVGSTARDVFKRRAWRERICDFGRGHWFLRRGSAETVFHPARTEDVTVAVDVRSTPTLGCAF